MYIYDKTDCGTMNFYAVTFLYVISPPTPTLRWPSFLSRSDLFLETPTGVFGPLLPC